MVVPVQFPEKLLFLFERWRYKGARSGRGAAKSWSFADALLMLGKDRTINNWRCDPGPIRVVCARETMESLKKSSYKLLCDRIADLRLEEHYQIQKLGIYGKNGTEFAFTGLSDPESFKSLEGADILWIEEAQSVSKKSWDALVPTLRREGVDAAGDWRSEIWASWNPELDTDETHVRLVVHPPTNAKVVQLSWRDNPWFPKVLDIERLDCQRLQPDDYRNIWEGETRSAVPGAIYAGEISAAMKAGNLGRVPRDRTKPVHTAWDLGFGDKTAVWFFQPLDGWYRMVDYEEGSGMTVEQWIIRLQQKNYLYGTDWLPHDAVDTIIHRNLAGGDKSRSIEMLMRAAGRKVRLAPKLYIADRINAGRTIFPQCQFDQDLCRDGIQALRRYQWGPANSRGVTGREPLHDDASHGADAFQTFAVCAKQPVREEKKAQPPVRRSSSPWV